MSAFIYTAASVSVRDSGDNDEDEVRAWLQAKLESFQQEFSERFPGAHYEVF